MTWGDNRGDVRGDDMAGWDGPEGKVVWCNNGELTEDRSHLLRHLRRIRGRRM